MPKFTRIEVVLQMGRQGLVPVFYHPELPVCKKIVEACYRGGARVFEFTNRGDYAYELYVELSRYVHDRLPDMMLGVGSVFDAPTATLYMQAGASFVVSPVVEAGMARVCNRRKTAWIPGCGSLTEISYAEELGAEVVKIFPGSQVGGPGFVSAVIKGPSPWTSIMPTGGVTPDEENLRAWFAAGVYCVGMGSRLFVKDKDGRYNYAALEEKVAATLALIAEIRS